MLAPRWDFPEHAILMLPCSHRCRILAAPPRAKLGKFQQPLLILSTSELSSWYLSTGLQVHLRQGQSKAADWLLHLVIRSALSPALQGKSALVARAESSLHWTFIPHQLPPRKLQSDPAQSHLPSVFTAQRGHPVPHSWSWNQIPLALTPSFICIFFLLASVSLNL